MLTPISRLQASAKRNLDKLHILSTERKTTPSRPETPISTDESTFGSHSDISNIQNMETLKLRHPVSPGRTRRSPRLAELNSVAGQTGGDQPIGGNRILKTPPTKTSLGSSCRGWRMLQLETQCIFLIVTVVLTQMSPNNMLNKDQSLIN